MSLLDNLGLGAGLLFDTVGSQQAIADIKDLGDQAFEGSRQLGQEAIAGSTFKPFTVSSGSGTGGFSRDAETGLGGTQMSLNEELQRLVGNMQGNAGTLFDQATQDPMAREQDIFAKLQALQQPGQQRDQLALEERLFNQGRSGVRTDAFGGTPEGLAMAKAIEETRNRSAVDAIGMGQAQQLQQSQIGQQQLQGSFLPEQNLLQMLGIGGNIADLESTAQRQGAGLAAQLGQTGLEAQINAGGIGAGLQQQQMSEIGKVLQAILGGSGGDIASTGLNVAQNAADALLQAGGFGTPPDNSTVANGGFGTPT